MKKTLLKIIFLSITLIVITTTVIYAVSNSKGRAVAMLNTERGGIVSEGENSMQKAKNTYDSKGYDTSILINPSPLTVLSNSISSKVQLYCCHGNTGLLEFPNGGICLGPTFTSSNGKEFYSIDNVDFSGAKLITLAACRTAGAESSSSSSIASQLVTKGAQMTIGWYGEVNPFSLPDWLDNFHKELDNGYDPLVAVNKANGEYYFNGNVRNTLFSYRSISTLSEGNTIEISEAQKNILKSDIKEKLSEEQIELKIKENNLSFDTNSYEKTYSEGVYTFNAETNEMKHINSYLDYTLKIGDYLTNSGYTVVINNDGTVEQIIDNTIKSANQLNKMSISEKNYRVEEKDAMYYISQAKQNITNQSDIINEEIKFYYDLETNKKTAVVTLKVADEVTDFKLYSYDFEI